MQRGAADMQLVKHACVQRVLDTGRTHGVRNACRRRNANLFGEALGHDRKVRARIQNPGNGDAMDGQIGNKGAEWVTARGQINDAIKLHGLGRSLEQKFERVVIVPIVIQQRG